MGCVGSLTFLKEQMKPPKFSDVDRTAHGGSGKTFPVGGLGSQGSRVAGLSSTRAGPLQLWYSPSGMPCQQIFVHNET